MDCVGPIIPALDTLALLVIAAVLNTDTAGTLPSTAVLGVRRVMELAFKLFVGFGEFLRREARIYHET